MSAPPVFPAAQVFWSIFFFFFCCNCKYTFFIVNLKYFLSLTDVSIIVYMICFYFSLLFDLQKVGIS